MNKHKNSLFAAVAVLLLLPMSAMAQLPTTTYGWNLGNTLEPGCGEGCWAAAAETARAAPPPTRHNAASATFETCMKGAPCPTSSRAVALSPTPSGC